jgi:hypothetical protein
MDCHLKPKHSFVPPSSLLKNSVTEIIPFLWLCLQSAAYYSAICWLCWWFWRTTGVDYLLLPALWLAATYVAHASATTDIGLLAVLFAVSATLAASMHFLVRRRLTQTESISLIPALVVTLLGLMIFEVATGHAPLYVTTAFDSRQKVLAVAAIALAAALWCVMATGEMTRLRMGVENGRFDKYWSLAKTSNFLPILGSLVVAWLIVVGAPLTTTGVLSGALFRDALFGILAARFVASRSGSVVLLVGSALGVIRTSAGVAVEASAAIAIMDAALLATLFLFVGRKLRQETWKIEFVD